MGSCNRSISQGQATTEQEVTDWLISPDKTPKIRISVPFVPVAAVDESVGKDTIEAMTDHSPSPSTTPRLDSTARVLMGPSARPVEWLIADGLTPYPDAVRFMEQRVADIIDGRAHRLRATNQMKRASSSGVGRGVVAVHRTSRIACDCHP